MVKRSEHPDSISGAEEPACLPRVTIEPKWAHWASALQSEHETRQEPTMRSEMGFDPDRPVVMSGHQPIVFHCGILAKLIALDEAAKRTNAQAVWIVPDQDAVDPGKIRLPLGSRESLRSQQVDLLPEDSIRSGVSLCSIPAMEIEPTNQTRLEPITQWLDQYATMETLAQQFAYATIEYACELLGIEVPRLIFASELVETQLFASWVDSMRQDPRLCAQAYNTAVEKYPDANVRALMIEDDRIELPLWGCRAGQERVAIDSINIDQFDQCELKPRGLMMSAIARAHLSDLFIHGVGGYSYDRISEAWIEDWIGIELKPMAMVTATHRLDLGFDEDEMVDPSSALWNRHHARHHPAMIGETGLQRQRDELVNQIERFDRKDPARQALYRNLQGLLDEYRQAHAEEIACFEIKADKAIELAEQYRLARDRTWAFVLFDADQLHLLDHATRRRLS